MCTVVLQGLDILCSVFRMSLTWKPFCLNDFKQPVFWGDILWRETGETRLQDQELGNYQPSKMILATLDFLMENKNLWFIFVSLHEIMRKKKLKLWPNSELFWHYIKVPCLFHSKLSVSSHKLHSRNTWFCPSNASFFQGSKLIGHLQD